MGLFDKFKKSNKEDTIEKKEQEVQTLKERAENQRKQKLLYIGLGIFGFLGAFFMFRSYHFRLRYSLEREKQLATEKNITSQHQEALDGVDSLLAQVAAFYSKQELSCP